MHHCSECGKEYPRPRVTNHHYTCGPVCARLRKTRLQKDRRADPWWVYSSRGYRRQQAVAFLCRAFGWRY